ncbi:hypothetical protein JD844_026407, partial [Phrynosoma platyrhinos]
MDRGTVLLPSMAYGRTSKMFLMEVLEGSVPRKLGAHVSQVNNNNIAATGEYLEKTIRSVVEQHLFDIHGSGGQSSEDSESGTSSTSSNVSARQRRRHHKEQDETRRNKE